MNYKKCNIYKFLVASFLSTILFSNVFAASLSLLKIGALDTGGKSYPEWWYVGTGPVLSGMATPGSDVSVKIGENSYTTTPDASGNWSYSATLEKGDYPIEISQSGEKISFTLHMGQDMAATGATQPSDTTPDATAVPETGYNQYVAFSFGIGIILLATYFYFSSDNKKNIVFESRVLKED
ncbi:MAG TPA: hypothetical protein P5014_02480 [Patescibacteria group bacterium]|nr:hypothetical protein [bacterium]HRY57009.1 hypothetical protein [Patescibacteria group bacterium]